MDNLRTLSSEVEEVKVMGENVFLKVEAKNEKGIVRPYTIICKDKAELDLSVDCIQVHLDELNIMDIVFDTLDGELSIHNITGIIEVMG